MTAAQNERAIPGTSASRNNPQRDRWRLRAGPPAAHRAGRRRTCCRSPGERATDPRSLVPRAHRRGALARLTYPRCSAGTLPGNAPPDGVGLCPRPGARASCAGRRVLACLALRMGTARLAAGTPRPAAGRFRSDARSSTPRQTEERHRATSSDCVRRGSLCRPPGRPRWSLRCRPRSSARPLGAHRVSLSDALGGAATRGPRT